jgi:histone H3/H4
MTLAMAQSSEHVKQDDDNDDDEETDSISMEVASDDGKDVNHYPGDEEDEIDLEKLRGIDESERDDENIACNCDDTIDVDEEREDDDEEEEIHSVTSLPSNAEAVKHVASSSANRIMKKSKLSLAKKVQRGRSMSKGTDGSRERKQNSGGAGLCRTPSVRGLTIPFRTIKKAMKLDPDIPIVQNEAAIMTTVAVELFLKRLVTKSNQNAKYRGRNTVRYEDVAEARTADKTMAFLEPLLP